MRIYFHHICSPRTPANDVIVTSHVSRAPWHIPALAQQASRQETDVVSDAFGGNYYEQRGLPR